MHWTLSIPPKTIKNSAFPEFQGVQKETSVMKWVNHLLVLTLINLFTRMNLLITQGLYLFIFFAVIFQDLFHLQIKNCLSKFMCAIDY